MAVSKRVVFLHRGRWCYGFRGTGVADHSAETIPELRRRVLACPGCTPRRGHPDEPTR